MNIIDALESAKRQDLWARPVSWGGSGTALCFKYPGDRLYSVPNARGGSLATMPSLEDIRGDWEVVIPNEVNRET